jgi:quercetin dioxygenase-like cupin family protein
VKNARPATWTLSATLALVTAVATGARAEGADEAMGRRVQALLHAHQAEIFACILAQPSAVEGEWLVRVFVGDDGEAARAEVLKGDAGGQPLKDCVLGCVRTWDLSSLAASRGDQIVFPLAFRPDPAAQGALHVDVITLPRESLMLSIERPTALYVLGPAPLAMAYAPNSRAKGAVGDVLYLKPPGQVALTGAGATKLLRVTSGGSAESTDAASAAPGQIQTFQADKVRRWPILGGKGEVQLYLDGQAAPFAVDRLCAKKGAAVPRHEHPTDEVVYLLSGRTRTELDGKPGREGPGDQLIIPRGTPHALTVVEDMCAVQIYAPSGPEQRFKRTTP